MALAIPEGTRGMSKALMNESNRAVNHIEKALHKAALAFEPPVVRALKNVFVAHVDNVCESQIAIAEKIKRLKAAQAAREPVKANQPSLPPPKPEAK